MNVVWTRDGATGREVCDALSAEKPVAYTTIVTLMNILVAKGHLLRVADGRHFRYEPKTARRHMTANLVRDFIDRVFAGSPQSLMAHLVEEAHLSPDEVKELLKDTARKEKKR